VQSNSVILAPGQRRRLTLEKPFEDLFVVNSPGTVQMRLLVSGEDEYTSRTFNHTFNPGQLNLTAVRPVWSGNKLQKVYLTVHNPGDFTAEFAAKVEGPRKTVELGDSYQLSPRESQQITLQEIFGPIYAIKTGGKTTLTLKLIGPKGTHSYPITRNITGSQLSIQNITPRWSGGTLKAVDYTLQNTGGVPSSVTLQVSINNKTVAQQAVKVPAENTVSEEVLTNYQVTHGGEYTVTVSIPSGEKSTTRSFEGVSVDLSDVSANFNEVWNDESKASLTSVDFSVKNTGDITLSYDYVEYVLEGYSRTDTPIYTSVKPGQQRSISSYFMEEITVEDGMHKLTIRFVNDGETAAEKTVTVSTSDSL
ncbi:MAG: immunity protein YezG family protein, partial [Halobacteriaceae archaeon]